MSTTTLTSKGQVTVPADVRAKLGLEPGNKLDFRVTGPGLMEVTVRAGTVAGLFGVVPAHGKRLAAEDMGDAIGRAAAEAYLEATA